ncbi:MAG: YkgJ family cysteine cluster protein [Planctomycetes bacterium]|nr:YkgJ family cysteine cluster protein [Planctomycetota bacterium]
MTDGPNTWFLRGLTELAAELDAAPVAATLADSLRDAAHRAFARSDTVVATSPDAPQRACLPGCALCCHYRVGVTAAEAAVLADAVRKHRDRDRLTTAILRRAAEAARGNDAPRRACALLGADARCTVYAVRPLPCRGWTSTDRRGCEWEHQGLGGTPRPEPTVFPTHLGLARALAEHGAREGVGDATTELHAALAHLLGP